MQTKQNKDGRVIKELVCPNCKKTIQEIEVRKPTIRKYSKHKRGRAYKSVRGFYKLIIKNAN